jgi:hypothetical protein
MSNNVQCATHGEAQETFVCTHLAGDAVALGFNRDDPTEDVPFPDACCDDCELIRSTHGGWNDESQKLVKISLLCCRCYERTRIRNTRTSITLDDLADLRWKCGSCDEWHTGPCLDFAYDSPEYWSEECERAKPQNGDENFIDENYCVIGGQDFFVRGIIQLPIIGTAESFRWGVWGSLSRKNFEALQSKDDDRPGVDLPPMFSWLSTQIPEYPDTLNLKMYARAQKSGWKPHFELEPCDHPLSQEYYGGITAERVKEIMMGRLRENK